MGHLIKFLLLMQLIALSFKLDSLPTVSCMDKESIRLKLDPEGKMTEKEYLYASRKYAHEILTPNEKKLPKLDKPLHVIPEIQIVDLRKDKSEPIEWEPQIYGVIIDCGSSGTRAHLYQWDAKINHMRTMLNNINPMRDKFGKQITKKITPGLSSLASKSVKEREEYIKPLIEFVADEIHESRHQFTGVYFMATAGMRLLSAEDRDDIMKDIKRYVQSNYKFDTVDISVISGTEEGMYQWISINAKKKRFVTGEAGKEEHTFAVIEMGGASLQVTFEALPGILVQQTEYIDEENERAFWKQYVEPDISRGDCLRDRYTLHSTTFLGFGVNSAREFYLDLLIAKRDHEWVNEKDGRYLPRQYRRNKLLTYTDPCLPLNYEPDEVLHKPVRLLERYTSDGTEKKPSVGYSVEEGEATFQFKVKGIGNYDECRTLMRDLIYVAKREKMLCEGKDKDACPMALLEQQFVPFRRFEFYAISGFFYATVGSIIQADEQYDHDKILRKAKEICNTEFSRLINEYGEKFKEEHIVSTCFRVLWADSFLVFGLGMPPRFRNLKVINKINDDDLDWTLGAILEKSLAIDYNTRCINPALKV